MGAPLGACAVGRAWVAGRALALFGEAVVPESSLGLWGKRIPLTVVLLLVGGACLFLDLSTPLGVAGGVPYAAVVLLTYRLRRAGATILVAALATALTVVGLFLSPGEAAPAAVYLTNRALAIFVIWAVALTMLLQLRTRDALMAAERERKSIATEQRRAQERLMEQTALARLGAMAAVVAHEVRNPLAGITGALQVLRRRMSLDDPNRPVLGDIVTRIHQLDTTLEDLLVYARPHKPRFGPVRLRRLARDVVESMRESSRLDGVDVEVVGCEVTIEADEERLQAALLNLLLNAVQAIEGPGLVEVVIHDGPRGCRLVVKDSGPGIPEELRSRIFEPFFTTRHSGTGLGLAIVKQTVDLHMGRIHVDCPEEGGTRFTLDLPARPDELLLSADWPIPIGAFAERKPAPTAPADAALDAGRSRVEQRDAVALLEMATGHLAHQLRNPLTGVLNAVRILGRGHLDEKRRATTLELMNEALERMKRTIDEAVTRVFEQQPGPARPLGLAEAVSQSCRLLAVDLERRGLELDVRLTDDAPRVLAGPDRLAHAVFSLLRHAVDTAENTDRIRVETSTRNGEVAVRTSYTPISKSSPRRGDYDEMLLAIHPRAREIGLFPALAERVLRPDAGRVEVQQGSNGHVSLLLWLRRPPLETDAAA